MNSKDKPCGDAKPVSGAGVMPKPDERAMSTLCGAVRSVCREDFLKQQRTDRQTNTHCGVQVNIRSPGSKSKLKQNTPRNDQNQICPEVPLANRPCENFKTSSAPAYSENIHSHNSCMSLQPRTDTKTLTKPTNCQPRQCEGVGGLVDDTRQKETLNFGGKPE